MAGSERGLSAACSFCHRPGRTQSGLRPYRQRTVEPRREHPRVSHIRLCQCRAVDCLAGRDRYRRNRTDDRILRERVQCEHGHIRRRLPFLDGQCSDRPAAGGVPFLCHPPGESHHLQGQRQVSLSHTDLHCVHGDFHSTSAHASGIPLRGSVRALRPSARGLLRQQAGRDDLWNLHTPSSAICRGGPRRFPGLPGRRGYLDYNIQDLQQRLETVPERYHHLRRDVPCVPWAAPDGPCRRKHHPHGITALYFGHTLRCRIPSLISFREDIQSGLGISPERTLRHIQPSAPRA